jgi:threonine aldolase
MKLIDLRSDTVTKPGTGMLNAMQHAVVGDDVFGEDPTVIELEHKLAGMFGMEAGLFCPSGTMTNQIAIKVHTRPADEVICDKLSHIYNFEGGGIAFNSGCSVKLLDGDAGRFTVDQVKAAVNDPENYHLARTSLVSVENTCNKGGGAVWDLGHIREIGSFTHSKGYRYHLDGARIFNAMAVNNTKPDDYGREFDSISVCLSKGLGAPAGSVLLGTKAFVKEARRVRKLYGGGMRQSGYLAAAGIYALDNNIHRLADDHRHATELANALSNVAVISEVLPVETNIVVAVLRPEADMGAFSAHLKQKGILVIPFGHQTIRIVTHLDVDDAMVKYAIEVLKEMN